MLGAFFDSVAAVISPAWGMRRAAHRSAYQHLRAESADHQMMRKFLGSKRGSGYEAGKHNRLTDRYLSLGSAHENDLPRQQIEVLRRRSWNLYRNNPQARKICRTLGAKVVGRGLSPQPQTQNADGTPFVEFRKRARQIWDEFSKEADFRGKPGRGGQHLVTLCKTALRQIMLSGGVLYRFRHLDRKEQAQKGLLTPLQLQLIHIDRLDQRQNGATDNKFFGVELDQEGRTVAYWVLKGGALADTLAAIEPSVESVRVPATEMGHLLAEEDVDQLLGSPWFGAALLTMDDRRNYEASELIGAEMASCIVAAYKRSQGQGQMGLPNPNANNALTDTDGNTVTHLQPGLVVDLGSQGELDIKGNPRPGANAEGFIGHLVRSEAVSVPGVKSSTLTGDYRQSSFSSERSADNDAWPEIEELQDWFACGFCQPIYEELISTAVVAGLFDKVKGFDAKDFAARKRDYLKANWQGPVARSINPVDDATAARERVRNGQSNPFLEASAVSTDLLENLDAFAEVITACKERELPDDIWQQLLGIDQKDAPGTDGEESATPTEAEQDDAMAALRTRAGAFAPLNMA